MYALAGALGAWISGLLLDFRWSKSRRTRALTSYILMLLLNTASWIWAVIIQNEYRFTHPKLDWAQESAFGRGFGFYVIQRIALGTVESYIYWVCASAS